MLVPIADVIGDFGFLGRCNVPLEIGGRRFFGLVARSSRSRAFESRTKKKKKKKKKKKITTISIDACIIVLHSYIHWVP
jgi:hypothetical protein